MLLQAIVLLHVLHAGRQERQDEDPRYKPQGACTPVNVFDSKITQSANLSLKNT